jgi:hypothetical protein
VKRRGEEKKRGEEIQEGPGRSEVRRRVGCVWEAAAATGEDEAGGQRAGLMMMERPRTLC